MKKKRSNKVPGIDGSDVMKYINEQTERGA